METRNTTAHNGHPQMRTRASTGDILGRSVPPQKVNDKWRSHYRNLLTLREEMIRRKTGLVETAREELPAYSLHLADAGTDQYDMDFALSMISADQDAIYEIDQAINRIHQGTYGICEITGAPIDDERLTVIPWTRFSTSAQRQIEQEGWHDRVKFGARGTFAESPETEDDDDESETE
jgi:DnaK suppressor protein